jgi:outer membrane protein
MRRIPADPDEHSDESEYVHMKKKTLLCLALLGSAHVWAAEDMLSLYRDALDSDARFTAAQAQYAAIEQRVPQSFAALLPSVTLSANTTANDTESNTFSYQSYNSHGYTVNLTQPLFRWESNIAYGQSKVLVEQARAELELARQDLALRLTQGYFDVLFAEDAARTLATEREAIEEQLASANRRYELGTATITDVRDAKARFDLVRAQEIAARNEVASKREVLRSITNREPGELVPLAQGVKLGAPMPNDMQPWVESAQSDGLAVVAGQAALEIARLETRKARAGHYPKLDLSANYGESKSGTINTVGTDLDEQSVGLQLSMPLYSGGAVVARQRESAQLLAKAHAELDAARREGVLTARQAFLNTTSGLAQVEALQEALKSAETALQANQRGLELGVRANIDVLNAQQQLSVTERDLAKSRYDTLMSLLRLKAAAGRLGETDVQEINALLSASR